MTEVPAHHTAAHWASIRRSTEGFKVTAVVDNGDSLTSAATSRSATNSGSKRKLYAQWEDELPDWLKARIQRFRDAGGEKFLLEGWGYELVICRLADLMDRGLEADAEKLSSDEGVTGNQWNCAKALAGGRAQHGDGYAAAVPAGLSPITGSADYA